jgi:hypothetical protein
MWLALIGFVFSPIAEVIGHLVLNIFKRTGIAPDKSAQELLTHLHKGVAAIALVILICRAILLISISAAAYGFFFLR